MWAALAWPATPPWPPPQTLPTRRQRQARRWERQARWWERQARRRQQEQTWQQRCVGWALQRARQIPQRAAPPTRPLPQPPPSSPAREIGRRSEGDPRGDQREIQKEIRGDPKGDQSEIGGSSGRDQRESMGRVFLACSASSASASLSSWRRAAVSSAVSSAFSSCERAEGERARGRMLSIGVWRKP